MNRAPPPEFFLTHDASCDVPQVQTISFTAPSVQNSTYEPTVLDAGRYE